MPAPLRDVRVVSPAVSLLGPPADHLGQFGIPGMTRPHRTPGEQERPVVIAVTDDGTEIPLTEIHALLPAFARWQLPDTVVYVDAIPRTSVGKIDKKALRAAHAGTYRTTA